MNTDIGRGSDAKKPRKQQKRSVVTQQKLLSAAVEAFSEGGFKGTSTRDIADRAGVHHPLITYHFKNKDMLWRAAVTAIFREFNIALVKSLAEFENSAPRQRAEVFVRTYVKYAHQQPALHKIILQEASHPSERLDWLIDSHLRPLFEPVEASLEELQRIGVAPPGNPALLFQMIRGCAGGLLALAPEIKTTTGIDFDEPEALDELADMIISVFFSGNHRAVSAATAESGQQSTTQ
ncbi:MAG: TetR/AcrR family transcriptional regulator [Woeseiaceae bacterium]|nr:TetR/AcrR family transcriptional regulator [Woeseiaceae bacterium]